MMREKLLSKLEKKGKKLDPLEQEAKKGVIGEMSRQAGAAMGDKIHPRMKAEISSDSKEGMKKGLDKAAGLVDKANPYDTDPEKLVENAEEDMHEDLDHDNEEGESAEHKAKVFGHDEEGSPEEEAMESPEEESKEDVEAEHADHSPEELDAKIQHLMELKRKKEHGLA